MAKHSEVKQVKTAALSFVFSTVRAKGVKVKLNDIYTFVGDVWNTSAYFIQDAMKAVPDDIKIMASKKGGTFAVYTGKAKNTIKEVIMGGLFPHKYIGTFSNIDKGGMQLVKKGSYPKMFNTLAGETVELYKQVVPDAPTEYLQVTEKGNFHFVQAQ